MQRVARVSHVLTDSSFPQRRRVASGTSDNKIQQWRKSHENEKLCPRRSCDHRPRRPDFDDSHDALRANILAGQRALRLAEKPAASFLTCRDAADARFESESHRRHNAIAREPEWKGARHFATP